MTDGDAPRKRRGRPAAPEQNRRRNNLTFRIRDDLRQQIEERAVQNGRSISEEMEFITERFFMELASKHYEYDAAPLSTTVTTAVRNSAGLSSKDDPVAALERFVSTGDLLSTPKSLVGDIITKVETYYIKLCENIEKKTERIERENEIMREQLRAEIARLNKNNDQNQLIFGDADLGENHRQGEIDIFNLFRPDVGISVAERLRSDLANAYLSGVIRQAMHGMRQGSPEYQLMVLTAAGKCGSPPSISSVFDLPENKREDEFQKLVVEYANNISSEILRIRSEIAEGSRKNESRQAAS